MNCFQRKRVQIFSIAMSFPFVFLLLLVAADYLKEGKGIRERERNRGGVGWGGGKGKCKWKANDGNNFVFNCIEWSENLVSFSLSKFRLELLYLPRFFKSPPSSYTLIFTSRGKKMAVERGQILRKFSFLTLFNDFCKTGLISPVKLEKVLFYFYFFFYLTLRGFFKCYINKKKEKTAFYFLSQAAVIFFSSKYQVFFLDETNVLFFFLT